MPNFHILNYKQTIHAFNSPIKSALQMSAHEKRAWVRFFLLPRSHLHTSRYLLISTTFCLCRAWSQKCVSVLMFVCGLEYNPESPARAAQKWSINSVLKEEDEWRETHAARDTTFMRETNWRVPVQTVALNRSTRLPLTDNRAAQARLTDSLLDSHYYICMSQR